MTAASCNTDLLGSFRQQPARQPSIESCCLGTVKRCNQHGRYSRIVCHAAQALPSAEDEPPSNLEDVLGEVDSSGSYDETGAVWLLLFSQHAPFALLA